MFKHASRLGVESIISKQAASPYRSGRVKTWLKVKLSQSDSFVIAGFVPSTVDPKSVGARDDVWLTRGGLNSPTPAAAG